jgi:phosphoribosylformylglycinamidine cyclo-ligase
MRRLNYAKSGVDISKIKNLHGDIGKILESTFKAKSKYQVLSKIGHYASLIDFGSNILTLHADGVGTKVLIAQMIDRYDTIGIDCIAMCVNDLICVGSTPIALIDYLALEGPDENLVTEIMKGLVLGANEADIAIVGGETSIMPDVIKGIRGNGFDLVGLCIGVLKKGKKLWGRKLNLGIYLLVLKAMGYTLMVYRLLGKLYCLNIESINSYLRLIKLLERNY